MQPPAEAPQMRPHEDVNGWPAYKKPVTIELMMVAMCADSRNFKYGGKCRELKPAKARLANCDSHHICPEYLAYFLNAALISS